MLKREQFHTAGRIELAAAGVGLPVRVVALQPGAVGLVLARPPARGVLSVLSGALVAVLGAPVKLARRGRRVAVVVNSARAADVLGLT